MRKVLGLIALTAVVVTACSSAATTKAPETPQSVTPSQAAPAAAARTVELVITDGKITPASVEVKKGETITFTARNGSTVEVELIVGTQTDVDADKGDSLKEAEEIAAGTTKSVTYTFDGDGPYAYGDQLEDHYKKGAKGTIVLKP
jgi:plastocyanin